MDNVDIHSTACIDPKALIGAGTKVWHFCHVMDGVRIGTDCVLGQNVFVGRDVKIGNRVKIQNNVAVYTGVVLEDEVFVGPSVVFTNVKNPRSNVCRNTEISRSETLVCKGATIGANATIVCPQKIGRYALVGAGAVVTHEVMDFCEVIGNPAKHSGWRCVCGEKMEITGVIGECLVCKKRYSVDGDLINECL